MSQASFSKSANETPNHAEQKLKLIQSTSGVADTKQKARQVPSGNPCNIVPIAEIRKLFPKVVKAVHDRSLEEYGIVVCGWVAKDDEVVGALQQSFLKTSAQREARAAATDRIKGTGKNARVEVFTNVGVDAAGFVEMKDPKKGIEENLAYIGLSNGALYTDIAIGDIEGLQRDTVMKSLVELGKIAARSLK